ncbi:hypothetical protein EB118_12550 [bacterium]|nr:hypothetical protein [bacterium]
MEQLSFDKIIYRLKKLCNDPRLGKLVTIDPDVVAQRVVSSIYDGVTSCELDEEAARIAVGMIENPEYPQLASRIVISNLHKSTIECFSEVMETLYNATDANGNHMPILSDHVIHLVRKHKSTLNFAIDYNRDYLFDYFGFKTLEKSYLLRLNGVVVERPQHMYMRVALGIYRDDIDSVLQTYEYISQHYYTHASPTLFNSGTRMSNLSSCFLLGTHDSIDGIYKTITDCARISKLGGGIGVHISNIRAKGSVIRGTNGVSDGIVPMVRVYNATALYVDQSSRRKGSFAMYVEPWHADIISFLDLKKNQGHEDLRARDLFYAIWTPDYFMEQVQCDGDWYLMCPDECPGLNEVYGDDFKQLYLEYVDKNKYRKKVKAQEIWTRIMDAQIETGTPYICYKDAVNKKCNQKNLGTIKSSNLCAEISLYSDNNEYSVCFTGDTRVLTKDGYRRIDECDGLEVMSYFNNDVELKQETTFNTVKLIDNGKKDVYTLICYGTKPIKSTANHLFLTVTKRNYDKKQNVYQWKKLEGLQKNDKILLPCTDVLPLYDINPVDNKEYLNIGWMLGDRWQSAAIYGGPNEEFAKNKVTELVGISCPMHKNRRHMSTSKNGVFSWDTSKQSDKCLIKELYECTAHDKVIPEKIKLSTPNQISSFLSGLFSADGSVYIGKPKRFYVSLLSASESLLYDTQELLRCFAIESRVVKTKGNHQGHLKIENMESITRFNQYIGFRLCPDKQNKLQLGLKTISKRVTFKQFAIVKDIVYEGTRQVYDLCVPNTHNFIAEGQVVHNCNLASLALPKYVYKDEDGTMKFDFHKLYTVAKYVIGPMNKVIDNNYYPTVETERSNFRHRPLGIGVQGLADVYIKMGLPFESETAKRLNTSIFETLYYGCLCGSVELAKKEGPYESYDGSPFSEGKFQFDLAKMFDSGYSGIDWKPIWDWEKLRNDVLKYGVRNSMLTALMPTASTAQIMGNSEAFEPIDSCIFKRRVLSGEYIVVNKYLVQDLIHLGLWSKTMKDTIIANNGSIQDIPEIPDHIKEVYKTVWEISMKAVIEQCRDRSIFVDQMQSMNLFMASPNYKKLTSMHFYAWKNNLKTGMYYLRSKASASAGKFSVDVDLEKKVREKKDQGVPLDYQEEKLLCSIDNPEACLMCSG